MPKSISLCNMSAKYLSDFISHPDWMEKGYEDMYLSGSILAEVLPRFEDTPMLVQSVADSAPLTVTDGAAASTAVLEPLYVPVLVAPVAPVLLANGEPDWSKMSRDEVTDLRTKITQHNTKFLAWCRTPLARSLTFSDKQAEVVQRVLRFYSPRSDTDKQKDVDKQKKARPELPANEFTLQLLRAFSLSVNL